MSSMACQSITCITVKQQQLKVKSHDVTWREMTSHDVTWRHSERHILHKNCHLNVLFMLIIEFIVVKIRFKMAPLKVRNWKLSLLSRMLRLDSNSYKAMQMMNASWLCQLQNSVDLFMADEVAHTSAWSVHKVVDIWLYLIAWDLSGSPN